MKNNNFEPTLKYHQSKIEIYCKKGVHFSFNFRWYSIQLVDIASVLKVICWWPLRRSWSLRGLGDLYESLKKEKLGIKMFFQIMLNELLKSCLKMVSPCRKADVKQEIKELVRIIHDVTFWEVSVFKTWNTNNVKWACIFHLIWLVFHAIQLDIVYLRTGGVAWYGRGAYLSTSPT